MKKLIFVFIFIFTFIFVGVLYDTIAQPDEAESETTDYVHMNQFPDQMDILIYQLTEENIG